MFYRYGGQRFFPPPELSLETFSEFPVEVSPSGAFVLPFSQLMKAITVEKALQITPSVPYETSWDGNTLLISPTIPLVQGDTYHVSIEETARNIFGTALRQPYTLEYVIGADPHVAKIFPENEEMTADQNISILFSHAMVGEDQLHTAFTPQNLQLDPYVRGEWIWHDNKTLVFSPEDKIPLGTAFHLTAAGPLQTRDAALLNDVIDVRFSTQHLALLAEGDVSLNLSEKHRVYEPFVLTFNQPVDLSSLQEGVEVVMQNGKRVEDIRIQASAQQENAYELFTKQQAWLYDEEYRIIVDDSILPHKGNIPLGESPELVFITQPLIENAPQEGWYVHDGTIELLFAEDISLEKIQQALYVAPEQRLSIDKRGAVYRVQLPEFSQKKENIKLYITDAINSKEKGIISAPLSYDVLRYEDLRIDVQAVEDYICLYSNNPLSESSKLESRYEDRILPLDIERSSNTCEIDPDYTFISSVAKKYLVPERDMNLVFVATDMTGQAASAELPIHTDPVPASERYLQNRSQLFYQHVQTASDLSFEYETLNIQRVNIQICKLEPEKAIPIITTYEESWFTFAPNESKCQKYKSVWKTFDSPWGVQDAHLVSINSLLEEPGYGLYYVHVQAPSLTDDQGEPLETGGVIQYNPWHILSKKGDGGLVWITDRSSHLPISDAIVNFYSNEGELLKAAKTNQEGLALIPDRNLEFPFFIAKDNDHQVLVSTASQEGYEPWNYGVSFNVDEERTRYQFYVEDFYTDPSHIRGVFMLKEEQDDKLVPSRASSAVVVLVNAAEQILWREHRPFDDYGTLDFDIIPHYPLLDGDYQLNVCVGLHEGVCHGTNYWANIAIGASQLAEQNTVPVQEQKQESDAGMIRLIDDGQGKLSRELKVQLRKLDPLSPVLVTAERDQIFYQHIFIPDRRQSDVTFTITEEMIPEVVVTVSQFGEEGPAYDMLVVPIQRDAKLLGTRKNGSDQSLSYFTDSGKVVDRVGVTQFEINKPFVPKEDILRSFYPRLGTSVITAATSNPPLEDLLVSLPSLPSEAISDLVIIPGRMMAQDQEPTTAYTYVIAHDEEGHFSMTSQEVLDDEKIRIIADTPGFLRVGDKALINIEVVNTDHENQNLKVILSGESFDESLLNPLLLGVPANGSRVMSIPLRMNPYASTSDTALTIRIDDRNGLREETDIPFRIFANGVYLPGRQVMIHESDLEQSSIQLPSFPEGQWKQSIQISATPMAFVLHSIEALLAREPIGIEEALAQLVTSVHYQSFLNPNTDEEQQSAFQQQMETEMWFLQTRQRYDGGWGEGEEENTSDPILTSWIARGIGALEQRGQIVPQEVTAACAEYLKALLDDRANARIRDDISVTDLSAEEAIEEMMILNGLSSLRPSGIGYSHIWYTERESLPLTAQVLLLLSLEDFRDAGVSGMNIKIENLIQEIAQKRSSTIDRSRISPSSQHSLGEQMWIESEDEVVSNFLLSSWYLESLVRQASSRSDLPALITWLVQHQYETRYQSPHQQFAYLYAMSNYLSIYQPQILAGELSVEVDGGEVKTYQLSEDDPFKTFQLQREMSGDEEDENTGLIEITSQDGQPVFVELSWLEKLPVHKPVNKGLSVYQHIETTEALKIGDSIKGSLTIISAQEWNDVVVIQPQSAAVDIEITDNGGSRAIRSVGQQEKQYHFSVLPAGLTRIEFTWHVKHAGVFHSPQIFAQVREHPETYGISNAIMLEARTE